MIFRKTENFGAKRGRAFKQSSGPDGKIQIHPLMSMISAHAHSYHVLVSLMNFPAELIAQNGDRTELNAKRLH